MKRRLPTIINGTSVLAASSLPPLTAETNRHRPTAHQPGKPVAASHEPSIASSAHRHTSPPTFTAGPPNSTDSAANDTATPSPADLNLRHHPRAVVYGTFSRSAARATPPGPAAAVSITSPIDSTTCSRPTSTNAGNSA